MPAVILQKIGMNVPEDLRLGVIDVGVDHPLVWTEQMMPIMPVVRVRDANEAIDLAVAGRGRPAAHGRHALEEHHATCRGWRS